MHGRASSSALAARFSRNAYSVCILLQCASCLQLTLRTAVIDPWSRRRSRSVGAFCRKSKHQGRSVGGVGRLRITTTIWSGNSLRDSDNRVVEVVEGVGELQRLCPLH